MASGRLGDYRDYEETPVSIDIEQIRARAEAATGGAWTTGWVQSKGEAVVGGEGDVFIAEHMQPPDAEFIARAREDVPALVDEVKRLRSALDSSAVGHGIAVAHAGDWKYRAEMAEAEVERLRGELTEYILANQELARRAVLVEAERDRLRAAVDAVRTLADGPEARILFTDIRAALDEHLGED